MANTPGSGPSPTAETSTRAQIISGTARTKLNRERVRKNTSPCTVALRAARKPKGKLIMTAIVVPTSAISRVSSSLSARRGT